MSLGHPADPRSKDTGDHRMPEKRRQVKSASRTLRKTRVAWSGLYCSKSNPDRDTSSPFASDVLTVWCKHCAEDVTSVPGETR
jgi:hypothetical protein